MCRSSVHVGSKADNTDRIENNTILGELVRNKELDQDREELVGVAGFDSAHPCASLFGSLRGPKSLPAIL